MTLGKKGDFMKKIVSISLAVTLVLISVTACSNQPKNKEPVTENPVTETPATKATITEIPATETPAPVTPAIDKQTLDLTNRDVMLALNSYQAVLENRLDLLDTDSNEDMSISQLGSSFGIKMEVSKFAIVDLDNDNVPEVVLNMSANNTDYYFVILRYQGEKVYGYALPYRAFSHLKIDGIFGFSSGASNHGFGTITFAENTYSIDKITYCEPHTDSNSKDTTSYFVEHKSATEEEFDKAFDDQNNKPNVTWYDYSEANIEKHFSSQPQ